MSDLFSRLLRLVRLLQEPHGRTVGDLSRLLGVNRRTIYRDLERLEGEGFPVEQEIISCRYFLATQQVGDALTPEESLTLTKALSLLPQQDPVVQALRQKLQLQQELQPLQHQLRLAAMAQMVRELQEAIEQKQQIILEGYLSAHSNSCTNRLVEPIALENNHSILQAYEPASGLTKFYKIDRIGRVSYTGQAQRYRRKHKLQLTDAFGFSGEIEWEVSLLMNTRAATHLREEYYLTEPCISPNTTNPDYPFRYRGKIRNWQGIGRFVLGLPGDVVVEGPEELRGYLEGQLHSFFVNSEWK